MNGLEVDCEAFKKLLRERATVIMKEWEEAGPSQRIRPTGGKNQLGRGGAARLARGAEAISSAGPPMLVGWKEIAMTLGNISIRSAQRWEKYLGLPVARAGGTPVAEPEAIRQWKERHFNTTLK